MTRCGGIVFGVARMLSASGSAQGPSGGASIVGVVKDATGAVLPGVSIAAESPALIERVRSVVADEQGQYRIVNLRPGQYVVTFTLAGFGTVRREGIELVPNVSASVNAEMRLGTLEESITVSGATPLVDVQNVTQQNVLTRTLLDTVPTNKGMLSFAALTPAVVSPTTAQDVGGSKGEMSVRMVIHGGKTGDQKLLQDGMRYNSLEGGGTGRGFFFNPASSQEVTVELGSGGSAEYDVGGVHINIVPKDGGNRFSTYLFANYTNNSLQGNNLSDELKARGLRAC